MKVQTVILAAAALLASATSVLAQGAAPQREITQIKGDVYNFRNMGHNAVFMVTPAGIVLIDTINPAAATWLKAELKRHFNVPVKYVAYSHDHPDHSSGGEVFADTALFVAHQRAKEVIVSEKRPTAIPNVTFSESMTIELGGKKVELHYVGRNHSDNTLVAHFPAERIVFTVDWIPVQGLPFRDMNDTYFEEWIEGLKRVEQMDFDILAPGHGRLGNKGDVRAFRGYMEDLHAATLQAVRAGKSVEQAKADVTLEKYKDWGAYQAFRPLNIEFMYGHVKSHWRPSVVPQATAPAGAPKGN
jgi:glyoxylase-like metal-dependent hydrolase (beta-lactamase superfamily II)